MAAFKASARDLDAKMGHVFDALKRNGLWDNTLIVCTTDHGIAFPRMKCTLTDAGLGVMLILRGPASASASAGKPAGFTGGQVVDALASHVDIFPTLCDAAGIEPPDWLEGVSLRPLVTGEAASVRDEVHGEINYHAAYEPQRCVRTTRYKYIRTFDDRDRPVLPNCDGSPSKRVWLDAGWTRRDPSGEALYDLVFDPGEHDNRAGDPALGDVLTDMRARLSRWMQATGDPLLEGRVAAPPEARIDDVNAVHTCREAIKTAREWGYC
jgi:arylsulfatase A-like enzyme